MFEPKLQALRDLDGKLPEVIRLMNGAREFAYTRFAADIQRDVTPMPAKYAVLNKELAEIDKRFEAQLFELAKERAAALNAVMHEADPNSKRSRLAVIAADYAAVDEAYQLAKFRVTPVPKQGGRNIVIPAGQLQPAFDAIEAEYKPKFAALHAQRMAIMNEPDPAPIVA